MSPMESTAPEPEHDDLFAQEAKEETIELFLFELDGELYAVSVADVDQVMKIPPVTSVPSAPESILGIFHLRGKVIVAIDILKRMRIARASSFVPLYLFVAHRGKNHYAIVVDHVYSVVSVSKSEVVAITPVIAAKINHAYVKGMFEYQEPSRGSKKSDDFLISAETNKASEPEIPKKRPALWLDLEVILDEEEIRRAGDSIDPSTTA